jgi:hypothetical protein
MVKFSQDSEPGQRMLEAGWQKALELGAAELETKQALFIVGFRLGWRYYWATGGKTMEQSDPQMDDALGRVAYTAYCERQGWQSFSGDQLPGWDDVRLDIKLAWIAAAVEAIEHWRIHGTRET